MSLYNNDIDVFSSNPKASGFSVDTYRKANMARFYLVTSDKEPLCIFKAYYQGTFGFTTSLNTGSFSSDITSFMDKLGPLWRSSLRSVGKATYGEAWSGAFSMPMKPYIKGTEPLSFSIKCILPLLDKGDGTDTFQDNIQTPIDDLLAVTLPWKSSAFDSAKQALNDKIDDAINWLFEGTESTFWNSIQEAIVGFKEDFLGGIYMLNEPIQYESTNRLVLRIGPWRIEGVLIDKVDIEYSPLIYNNGEEVYPAFATVVVNCKTLNPVTPEILGVFQGISKARPFVKEEWIK